MKRCTFLVCMLANLSAYADEVPPHWEFSITPYLWFGSDHTTYSAVVPPGSPPLRGKTDLGDILPHLDSFPLMGVGEVRYGRFGLAMDIIALSANFGTHLTTPPFLAGEAKVSEVQTSAIGYYRILKTPEQSADLGLGLRAWVLTNTLTFGPASLGNRTHILNPILSGRYHHALPANFGVTLYGDIGGGVGGAKLVYQAVALLDYKMTDWLTFHAGYRYSYFDYRGRTIQFNAGMQGPLLGATFRF